MEIKNKVVIITGASQGIGLATARHLAQKGAKVILAARSEKILKELEKELPNSLAIKTDLRKEDDIHKMIQKTLQKFGRVDILINNAGQGIYGSVEKINVENLKEVMELNVYSVIRAMQAVIPHMRKQGGGMIVNVSSGVSKMYIPGIAAYSSTKYALNAISFIARQELAKDKIIVSSIMPKITATNFAKNAIGARPDFSGKGMQIDSAEYVSEKIAKLIESEETELVSNTTHQINFLNLLVNILD